MKAALSIVVLGLLAAGCGGGNASVAPPPPTVHPSTTTAETTVERPLSLELFFLAPDGKLVAASRDVAQTQTPGAATLRELVDPVENTTTEVPDGLQLTIDAGRAAHVTGASLDDAALAQIVYSLTSFTTVESVNGKTRADVEDFAPAILVEHPVAGEEVSTPLRVTGTANTFEATFNYRLEDAQGHALTKSFVTATSGSGTRGTFDFTVPFTIAAAQEGTLKVFELSAEDGSVIHERDIPLRLSP